jgi:BirA family biotin operon repressor/biotin-[acetyl-CoA-carboxylase] ligase
MNECGGPAHGIGDLHPARLLELIRRIRIARTVVLIDRCESTNRAAMTAVAASSRGGMEGTLLLAEEQYAGRGRSGRRWYATPGKSLTFSIVLSPHRAAEGLTPLMALSAARALDRFCAGIDVKWPNDLYLGGRKLGGILAEGKNACVVLGMGININEEMDDFTDEIAGDAISLRIHTGKGLDRGAVLAEVLTRFEEGYEEWERSGFAPFREALEDRLLYKGECVLLLCGTKRIEGTLLGITGEGYLRVDVNGAESVVAAGDVSLRW